MWKASVSMVFIVFIIRTGVSSALLAIFSIASYSSLLGAHVSLSAFHLKISFLRLTHEFNFLF